jgi:hypothetical protein
VIAASYSPTTCTVYGPGYRTQIIFGSQHLDVRAECQVWSANKPGTGYLWGYGPAAIPNATRLCALTDPRGKLKATVIEETQSFPASTAERAQGRAACNSILASGWIKRRSIERRG